MDTQPQLRTRFGTPNQQRAKLLKAWNQAGYWARQQFLGDIMISNRAAPAEAKPLKKRTLAEILPTLDPKGRAFAVGRFVQERCEQYADAEQAASELCDEYNEWARPLGFAELSWTGFSLALGSFEVFDSRKSSRSLWVGLRLR